MCTGAELYVASAILGIGSAVAGYQSSRQQVRLANARAQQQYEFQVLQTTAQRNYESNRQQLQDDYIEQNRWLAQNAFESQNAQLNLRIQQEQLVAAQKKKEAAKKALQARGEVVASGRVGNTIDNLVADVYRQQSAFDYATGQNLAFATMGVQEQKKSLQSQMAARIASAQPYLQRNILDPIKPIMQKSPSALPFILQAGSSVVSAAAGWKSFNAQQTIIKQNAKLLSGIT